MEKIFFDNFFEKFTAFNGDFLRLSLLAIDVD